jgi:hypothetical protein
LPIFLGDNQKTVEMKKIYVIILLFIAYSAVIQAQNIEEAVKKPFKLSGTLDINLGYYEAYGIEARRDRFSYLLAGNVNPRLFGIDMPLNASYSQQETTFLQPFNQVGISPQYKWITAHVGYRNLNYSPLTLNGHTFLGGGIDLQPRMIKGPLHFHLSAMYGRFRRSVEPIDAVKFDASPSYRRMGYAVKFGFVSKKKAVNYLNFILFKGYDVENSIEQPVNNQEVKPEDNLVLGLTGQYKFFDRLTFKIDLANSALTRDARAESAESPKNIFRYTGSLFNAKTSSQFQNAVKSSLYYNTKKMTVGLRYNRIAPDFRTLGSYFFQNNLEDLTINLGTNFQKGKIQVNGSIGFQRNNLDNQQNTQQERLIGSINFSHTVSKDFSYTLSYSNFSSSLLVIQQELSDSLNLYQVSTSYNGNANYNFGSKEKPQGLSINLGHQIGNARDEYSINETTTRFYNTGITYRLGLTPQKMAFQFGFNYMLNNSNLLESANVGPSASVSKKLLDNKIQARYLISYLANIMEGQSGFGILNNRFLLNYNIFKKHQLRTSIGVLRKIDKISNSYTEVRGTIGYRLSF